MFIHQAMRLVEKEIEKAKTNHQTVLIRVEDARLRRWYGRKEKTGNALQGVGYVKRDAVVWEDFLSDLRRENAGVFDFEMISPAKNTTKQNALDFKLQTGWTARTNVHGRDAAHLIWKDVKLTKFQAG